MRVTLNVIAGPHTGTEFSFDRHDTFLVGRSRHAHFQLPEKDRYFSRVHFMMEVNPPTRVATTGVPHANDSTATSPNDS